MKFTLIRLANDAGWVIERVEDYGLSQIAQTYVFQNGEVSAAIAQLTDLLEKKASSSHASPETKQEAKA